MVRKVNCCSRDIPHRYNVHAHHEAYRLQLRWCGVYARLCTCFQKNEWRGLIRCFFARMHTFVNKAWPHDSTLNSAVMYADTANLCVRGRVRERMHARECLRDMARKVNYLHVTYLIVTKYRRTIRLTGCKCAGVADMRVYALSFFYNRMDMVKYVIICHCAYLCDQKHGSTTLLHEFRISTPKWPTLCYHSAHGSLVRS